MTTRVCRFQVFQTAKTLLLSAAQIWGSGMLRFRLRQMPAVVMLNTQSTAMPASYMWSTNSGTFAQPNGPTFVVNFPQYPLSGNVVLTDEFGCTYFYTFFIQQPQSTCNVDFSFTVVDNYVTISETYNGVPINPKRRAGLLVKLFSEWSVPCQLT
jgi:hypothetical protein